MSQLSAENLCLGYDGIPVSKDINFQINKGDYLCIVGENGSGKSTLIKTLLGLKSPLSGKIIFDEGLSLREIGYLPQQTSLQQDFPASVYEVVLSGCLASSGLHPFYNKKQKKMALDIMKKFNIEDKKNECFKDLSGGQQQRVLLARALCATKKMLLMDEPVSGLDPIATEEMYKIVDQLNKNENITIIMVSHDIHSAVKYASHILHLGDTLHFFGTKEDYAKSPIRQRFSRLDDLSKYIDEPLCSRTERAGKNTRRFFK